MPRLYKGSEHKYRTGIKVPDGTIKEITLTFYTDNQASFKKTYSKNEIEVIDDELSCNIYKEDTLLLNEGVLCCCMESSVVKDGFPDTFDSVFKFDTPFYLKDTPNPVEIKFQEKTVTDNGTYTADDEYVALSKVNVEVPFKNVQDSKEVIYSDNGSYAVMPNDGYDAMSNVTVNVNVPDLSKDISKPYVSLNCKDFTVENFNALTGYEKLTSVKDKFRDMTAIIPKSNDEVTVSLDLPNVEDASYFLAELNGGSSQHKINLSFTERSFKKCENFYWFMYNISNVTFLNSNVNIDLSNGNIFEYCYYKFQPMGNVTCKANISTKCTSLRYYGCLSQVNWDWTGVDTSNVEDFNSFLSQTSLTDILLLNFSKAKIIKYMLWRCYNLTNVGGFLNLGKSMVKSVSDNILDLGFSSKLTTESVLNIFNNLYSVDATFGCTIKLNSAVYGNLTEDQITIATNKGWTITT